MATDTFKGRDTAGSGDPEDLSAAQARGILNVEDGATASPYVAVEDEGTGLTTGAKKLNFAGAGVTATEPVADEILVTIPGAGAGSDTDAIHDNVNNEIAAVTQKTDPVSGDYLLIEDSAASNAKKHITMADLVGLISTLQPDLSAIQGVMPNITPFLGSWSSWSSEAAPGDEDVYYQRMFLVEGTYDGAEVALVSGANSGRTIDIGVYADDGGSPPLPTGALLVSTGPQDTNGADETFFQNSFTSNLVVPSGGGYYWVAFVCNDGGLKISSTQHEYMALWQQRIWKEKSNYGTATLGALAGFDTADKGVLFYIGIRRQ
jgi:hypothetical protein